MSVIVNLLIWVHLLALIMGFAGGIAMSQIGPRLAAAAPDQRATWWPLANTFTGIAHAGLVLLLVTGPLILWLKYQGGDGLSTAFAIKMGLMALAIIAIGASSWGRGAPETRRRRRRPRHGGGGARDHAADAWRGVVGGLRV